MKSTKKLNVPNEAFELNTDTFLPTEKYRHVYNGHIICVTDSKGNEQPDGKSVNEIRVDATSGFIPVWDKGVGLNWRMIH